MLLHDRTVDDRSARRALLRRPHRDPHDPGAPRIRRGPPEYEGRAIILTDDERGRWKHFRADVAAHLCNQRDPREGDGSYYHIQVSVVEAKT